jgi:hypothetical protein
MWLMKSIRAPTELCTAQSMWVVRKPGKAQQAVDWTHTRELSAQLHNVSEQSRTPNTHGQGTHRTAAVVNDILQL